MDASDPKCEADIAETEAADAAAVEEPSAVSGSDAMRAQVEPPSDEVPDTSVAAMPDARRRARA